jgi:bacterioferritin-associated ferredoxin
LRQYVGADLAVNVVAGSDYPEDLKEYKLVIQCGGCVKTRREMLSRLHAALRYGVPVTNYGVCISYLQGVLPRILSPFPSAFEALRHP